MSLTDRVVDTLFYKLRDTSRLFTCPNRWNSLSACVQYFGSLGWFRAEAQQLLKTGNQSKVAVGTCLFYLHVAWLGNKQSHLQTQPLFFSTSSSQGIRHWTRGRQLSSFKTSKSMLFTTTFCGQRRTTTRSPAPPSPKTAVPQFPCTARHRPTNECIFSTPLGPPSSALRRHRV